MSEDEVPGGLAGKMRLDVGGAFEALEQQLMAIACAEEEDGLEAADALMWALLKLASPAKLGRLHVWRA